MDKRWSDPVLDVDGGASRVLYVVLLMFAGMTGLLALACSFDDEMRGPGLVIAGIPAALVGGVALWVRHRARARRISLHHEGVRETRGARVTELRWSEIETISVRAWQVYAAHLGGLGAVGAIAQAAANGAVRAANRNLGALPYDSTQVTVKLRGAGRTIVLRKWDARWQEAYAEIRARVEPGLLATARARLAAGAAEFGAVRVGPEAVFVGKRKVVRFGELERVDLDRYMVLFRARGKRLPAARAHIAHVPNLHVMLHLVGERAARPSVAA